MYRLFISFLVYVQSVDDASGDYFLSTVFPTKKIDLAGVGVKFWLFSSKKNITKKTIANKFSSDDSSEDSH